MNYVTYSEAGILTGAFNQELQDEHASAHIEVTEDQRQHWTAYRANSTREGLELVPAAPPAPPSVPGRVPMLNAHLVLIDSGWIDGINAYIDSLPDVAPDRTRSKARAYFNLALTMERDHPLVLGIPQALGKTDAEVDQLFIAAAALQV